MNASQLRPASDFCKLYGCKIMVYGGPGTAKTPLTLSAPNPVLCAMEPGLLSIRSSNIPVWGAFTYAIAKEFVDWAIGSQEARQFHTFCFDSISQLAEIRLAELLPKFKDPRKAYGEMSNDVMELLNRLYYAPYMHIYLIAKETLLEIDGSKRYRPYFPGQDLHVKVPHLYDLILRVSYKPNMQGGAPIRAFDTAGGYDFVARDRIGRLAPVEPADLGYIINKSMQ